MKMCYPHPARISIPAGACPTTPTLGISVIFQLGYLPPRKNIFLKNAIALYFYAKDNCFCEKARKIFLYMLIQSKITSILPRRGLS